MHSLHSRVLCTGVALVLAVAPGLGCAALGKLLGIKKEEEAPAEAPAAPQPPADTRPPPQPEYTEEQWAEYTALAEAKVKEAGGVTMLPPLRLVGKYPYASQKVAVKGGHCYDVGAAWMTPGHRTSFDVTFLKDAEGRRSNLNQGSTKARLEPPAGVMQFCADLDGRVELTAYLLTTDNTIYTSSTRQDNVQWAVAVAERAEDKQAAEARRVAEAERTKAREAQGRRNVYRYELEHYGRRIADACERCRKMFALCMEERKDKDQKKALEYCGLDWQNCAEPMGRDGGSRRCTTP